ncbi:Fc receptor-like A [Clinocottus analis]|uniref:Fc receptor-like A n=1 Tax=Clinocottus analis TaxID=304258 RepID=UPI0035C0EBD8
MDAVISLLVLSTLPQLVVPEFPSETSFRAVVELLSGDSRIFSGEGARLKCSIPDVHATSWRYLWFRGSELLPQAGQQLILWQAKVQESGELCCQGVRDTRVGEIRTLKSLPLELNVDGGWAILQVPPHPGLVGETLKVTCRMRVTARLHEVILYKDGVEVIRQNGLNPHFYLSNLTLGDQGMYSCRASWDSDRRTHSVVSADASVQVLEVLSQPFLEIVSDNTLTQVNKMKLVCHLQYNARPPAPPVNFFFYKNGHRLGTAMSENNDLVRRTPGQYSCKARVLELGISRESEPKSFGEATGSQTPARPTAPRPLGSTIFSPAAEPAAARPSPLRSTTTPASFHPAGASLQSSYTTQKPSQSAPSTLVPTVQSRNQTAAAFNVSMESGDITEGSGDITEELDDMFEGSGDITEGDITEGDVP